jgi:hypothetical protein
MQKLIAVTLLCTGLVACGSSGGGSSTDAFCEKARVADSFSTDFGNLADDATPAKVEQMLDGYIAASEAAVGRAPEDIEASAKTIAAGLKDLRDIASNNGFDLTKTFDDPAFVKLVDDTELHDASTELDAFLEKECGITPASEDTAAPTPDTTALGGEGLAEQLADEFAAGAGIELTPEQRTCVGQGLLDEIGLGTLAGMADAADLDPGTLSKIFAVLDGCGVAVPTS